MNQKDKTQWMAIFIVATGTDQDLQQESVYLVNELLTTKLTENLVIIFCITTQVSNIQNIDRHYKKNPETLDDEAITLVYRIRKAIKEQGNEISLVDEIKDFRLQNSCEISEFLKRAKEIRPHADRYILFTWNHGNMYGIFNKQPQGNTEQLIIKQHISRANVLSLPVTDFENRKVLPVEELNKKPESKIQYANITPYMLSNTGLSVAMLEAFGKKIDVLVMTNCYMQEFDTGYELKDAVEYLIAPETTIDMRGFNCKAIIGKISRHPNISAKKIGKIAIKSFKNHCKTIQHSKASPNRREEAIAKTAVSAIALKHYSGLSTDLDRISRFFIDNMDIYFEILKEARKQQDFLDPRYLTVIDPYYFLNKVGESINNPIFQTHLRLFNKTYQNAIAYKYIGKHFSPTSPKKYIYPNGFSIYFPLYQEDLQNPCCHLIDLYKLNAESFFSQTSWYNFVIQFATRVGNNSLRIKI